MRFVSDVSGRRVGTCDACGVEVFTGTYGSGDFTCMCGVTYNAFGQRLRSDILTRRNPSETDDSIGDLEGDEMSYGGGER
jgi:hypothetical protein